MSIIYNRKNEGVKMKLDLIEIETKNYVIFIYNKNPLNNYFMRSKDLINI